MTFFSDLLGYEFDAFICKQFQAFCYHSVLDFLFANDCFITAFLSGFLANIIVISLAGFTCTAVADHHIFAVTAKQLCCQQILTLAVRSCRSFLVFVQNILYFVKYIVVQNPRHTARRFLSLIHINSYISFIAQHSAETVISKIIT